MVIVSKAFKRLVPHYVIRESSSGCNCDINDVCECMPDLYLTENGYTGYGSAFWTYCDETTPPGIEDGGKAYYCTFAGVGSFWAMGEQDAAEKLLLRFDQNNIAANVNFKNNRRADEVMKTLKEEEAKYKK